MPLQPQPPGHRGTVGHPYSALNLRLGLAVLGVVACAALAAVLFAVGQLLLAVLAVLLALVAVIDIAVIQGRRRAQHRAEGDGGRSLPH